MSDYSLRRRLAPSQVTRLATSDLPSGYVDDIHHPLPVGIGDGANLDAFSRLRVSNPTSLFSTQCQYNTSPLQLEAGATGTGVAPAHSANTRMVALSATTGTGTSFVQSFRYIPYQPGKSHLVFVTGVLGAGLAGAVVDAGYFDAANGIIFRQNGASGLQFIRRTSTSGSVVNNTVEQADWNHDPLNGTGPSGIALDATKDFILIIDLQFLAMGRVRVGFDIGGKVIYAHEFLHANVLAVPYMQTATLPVAMLLTATDTGSTKTCYFKCASVSSEGGLSDDFAFQFSTPSVPVTASSGARTHVMSIRPKTTYNSLANRTMFVLESVNLLVIGDKPVFYEVVLGQAITGASYADCNTTYSGYEYGTGTISGSPAVVIASGYSMATNQIKSTVARSLSSRYPITLDRAGAVRANGTLSLLVAGIGGTSDVAASIEYSEIR